MFNEEKVPVSVSPYFLKANNNESTLVVDKHSSGTLTNVREDNTDENEDLHHVIFVSPYFNKGTSPSSSSLSSASSSCLESRYFVCSSGPWSPPPSPYGLIQERLYSRPWQLLVATIFLNRTRGSKALPLLDECLYRWPTPDALLDDRQCPQRELEELLRPLGLQRRRARTLKKFSLDFVSKKWQRPSELFGVGKYGDDSYRIFCCRHQWKSVSPQDEKLTLYHQWLSQQSPH